LKIIIHVFGGLKDYLEPGFELTIPDRATLADLRKMIGEKFPASKNLLFVSQFAVSDTIESQDYRLKDGDQVFVLPPPSGG